MGIPLRSSQVLAAWLVVAMVPVAALASEPAAPVTSVLILPLEAKGA